MVGMDVEMRGRETEWEEVRGPESDKSEQCERNEPTVQTQRRKENFSLFLWMCTTRKKKS